MYALATHRSLDGHLGHPSDGTTHHVVDGEILVVTEQGGVLPKCKRHSVCVVSAAREQFGSATGNAFV